MKQWYVLRTKLRTEQKVALRLEYNNIETYLPEIESQALGARDRHDPFFPGYLFIRLDLSQANPALWRSVPGVRYIVSYGEVPVPVQDELIQLIFQQIKAMEARRKGQQGPFEPGDHVRIMNGPFRDMIAIFDGPTKPAKRVRVLLKVLSQSRRICIDASDLVKASIDVEEVKLKRPRRTRGRGRRIRA